MSPAISEVSIAGLHCMMQPAFTALKVKQTPYNNYMGNLVHATTALASTG